MKKPTYNKHEGVDYTEYKLKGGMWVVKSVNLSNGGVWIHLYIPEGDTPYTKGTQYIKYAFSYKEAMVFFDWLQAEHRGD